MGDNSDSSDMDLDNLDYDAEFAALKGDLNTLQALLDVFGCKLEGNKFKHTFMKKDKKGNLTNKEETKEYTINFKWTDYSKEVQSEEDPIESESNGGVIRINTSDRDTLQEHFRKKTISQNYKRKDTMLDMVKKESTMILNNQDFKRALKWIKDDANNQTHLIFCFASPLRAPASSTSTNKDLPLLNFKAEFKGIESALRKIGRSVRYSKKVATAANFGELFASNPCVLHFSGHGVKVHSELRGNTKSTVDEEGGDYLVIEDGS